jgi:phosphoribosylglycinamide formyltransferase-1
MTQRIAILISGRGSNMEAIVRACTAERWPAKVVAVVANRPDAGGLAFAAGQGIATAVVDHKAHPHRDAFDATLADVLDGFAPDVVVLAGFMRILGAAFVRRFEGRLLNIHPSLLPAFPGLHTHRRALEAGCKAVKAACRPFEAYPPSDHRAFWQRDIPATSFSHLPKAEVDELEAFMLESRKAPPKLLPPPRILSLIHTPGDKLAAVDPTVVERTATLATAVARAADAR